MRRSRFRIAASAGLVAMALSSCSALPQGDHRWVSNSKEGMYTRIPNSYRTYMVNPYEQNTLRAAAILRSPSRWTMIIDSAPRSSKKKNKAAANDDEKKKSITRLGDPLPSHLIGEMSVQPLSSDWATGNSDPTLREALSVGLLRSFAFSETSDDASNTDPLKEFMAGTPDYEVIVYEETFPKSGGFGAHIRMNLQVEPFKWVTVDQHIYVDRRFQKMYRLLLKCEAGCFKRNYAEAKRISSNWTVKK